MRKTFTVQDARMYIFGATGYLGTHEGSYVSYAVSSKLLKHVYQRINSTLVSTLEFEVVVDIDNSQVIVRKSKKQ